ncbi:uncharacterized protein LOC127276975 [Leptopilina boulardi]|uniref:uncharacterized protein LOC127276975 n=1 Tax=Leptopilina boulardi TaxID=63433 RepID=UPI0021F62AC6|nr:uncharacterized protein LOC127276975 [Leptopilina boulardi]
MSKKLKEPSESIESLREEDDIMQTSSHCENNVINIEVYVEHIATNNALHVGKSNCQKPSSTINVNKRKTQRPNEKEELKKMKRKQDADRQRTYRQKRKNKESMQKMSKESDNITEPIETTRDELNSIQSSSHYQNTSQNTEVLNVSYSNSDNENRCCDNTMNQRRNNSTDVQEHYIGPMDVLCEHCEARHFAAERVSRKKNSFNDCCSHGEVVLEPLPEPPTILNELFNGTHEESRHFFERIRWYNNSFAFASFNANLVNFNNRRPGPYCFKIHGQIYYQINTSLYPSDNENLSFGQLFIVDQNEATHVRCQQTARLNPDIITKIDQVLRDCNIFAKSYQMMHEELQSASSQSNTQTSSEMQLLFSLKPGIDLRRYNQQRVNEVAAIFTTTADGEIPESYISIRNKQSRDLQFVSTMDANVEPWIYPLFYPHGTQGWTDNIPHVHRRGRVTRSEYMKFRSGDRENNVFLQGRRLFQQWVVDGCVKIEKDGMNFYKNN